MFGRIFFTLLLVIPNVLNGEIIQFSNLNKPKNAYKVIRDLFSPDSIVTSHSHSKSEPVPLEHQGQVDKEKELIKKIEQRIFFEGYVFKSNRSYALLNINGEYFVAGEGDEVLENIKVKKIERKKVFLEVESSQIEISLKGENNE